MTQSLTVCSYKLLYAMKFEYTAQGFRVLFWSCVTKFYVSFFLNF